MWSRGKQVLDPVFAGLQSIGFIFLTSKTNFYSGGMYNTKFPEWEDATASGSRPYDGQFAYAYAKRGQVLLCERWAAAHPKVFIPLSSIN